MTELRKQIAYLEGLAEGMRLDADSDQGKLFRGLVSALDAVRQELEAVSSRQQFLEDYASDLEDRVIAVEDVVFPDVDEVEDEDDEDLDDLDVECPNCGYVFALSDGEVEVDDEAFDVVCPECGQPLGVPGDAEELPAARPGNDGVAGVSGQPAAPGGGA